MMNTLAETERRFHRLSKQWREATATCSSTVIAARHPAAVEMVAMGMAVLPLMFARVKRRDHFFLILIRQICGDGPVIPDGDRGRVDAMCEHWLRWGRDRGFLGQTKD